MNTVDADDWILVHDAARPCLPRRDLDSLLRECQADAVGGLLALPVAETVKKAAKDEAGVQRIAGTEDRAQLWLAQTPQMFRAGLLAQALRRATGPVTDEASAIEQMGLKPRLVTGSRENLKVTFAEDLAIAETLLGRRA
jgi:2-C-methyl-D-erythritol 4-phosphate cytidylyltransferase